MALLLGLFLPLAASAQDQGMAVTPALMQETFPGATRFSQPKGTPPVWEAYAPDATGKESLAGYLFLTSDWPPEEKGYSGPIKTLVGLDTSGKITGARVIYYHESLQSSRGDFLREGPFERQLSGKHVSDPFRLRLDVFTVSGATISAGATVRGVRDAARRVAQTYLVKTRDDSDFTAEEIDNTPWAQLVMDGFGERLIGTDGNLNQIEVFLLPVDEPMGRKLLGDESYNRAVRKLGPKAAGKSLWFIGLDGPLTGLFRANAFTIERATDTLRFATADLGLVGEPHAGKVDIQYRNAGLIAMDPSLDPKDEFTFKLDFGGRFRPFMLKHPGDHPVLAAAPTAPAPAATTGAKPSEAAVEPAHANSDATPRVADAAEREETADAAEPLDASAPAVVASAPAADAAADEAAPAIDDLQVDFSDESEMTILQRTIEETSWVKFWLLAGLLVLATAAFVAKRTVWLRWATLASTVALLGFGGGGFLSVSHITAAMKVGPTVFLQDLPLLLLVAFTVVTTLLFGRIFCGYLCPFGALQDFMDRVVPKKLRRKLPDGAHRVGLNVKYGVLAGILVPVMLGSETSIFQYFEPFGTVFFFSRSALLWSIAAAILVATAIVPRFYCRYMCPLGASLAIGSLLSPFRIKRVPQCSVCTVCEHACPTGAISNEKVNFKECVRCNDCETKLKEKAGVCKHDAAKVAHLIQLKRGQHHLHKVYRAPEAVGGD